MNVKISGHYAQYLEIDMPPNEIFISEAGAMTYHEDGIQMELLVLQNGFSGLLKRLLTGEGVTLVKFINKSSTNKKLVLSSNAGVCPVKIDGYSNELICRKSSFFSCTKHIDITVDIDGSITSGIFGGLGFIRQRITGTGTAFLRAHGQIKKIELTGNKLILDSSAVLAFTNGLTFSSNILNPIKHWFAGEGGSQEQISGHGTIWIQCYNNPIKSSPFSNLYSWLITLFFIYIIFSVIIS